MSALSNFFFGSSSNIIQYECISISHPSITTKQITRNATRGLTTGTGFYQYCPMRITEGNSYESLDASIKIELGDLGMIVSSDLDAIRNAGTFGTKPNLTYYVYRSDDLATPLKGPLVFEISSLELTENGCVFEAKLPTLNITKTGEIYSIDRFVGLAAYR